MNPLSNRRLQEYPSPLNGKEYQRLVYVKIVKRIPVDTFSKVECLTETLTSCQRCKGFIYSHILGPQVPTFDQRSVLPKCPACLASLYYFTICVQTRSISLVSFIDLPFCYSQSFIC
jgi:hypothetical protein